MRVNLRKNSETSGWGEVSVGNDRDMSGMIAITKGKRAKQSERKGFENLRTDTYGLPQTEDE